MKFFKKKLLAAVTVMALSPLAQAGLVSFSDSHNSSTTDWTDTLTVAQFDSSLGNLDTIDISFSADMLTDMILDNDNATAENVKGTAAVDTLGSFLGLGSLNVSLSATTGFQLLGADDSLDTDAPLDGGADEFSAAGLVGADSLSISIDSSNADFLSFIGAGTVSTVGLGTIGGFSILGGGGNVDVNINTFAAATLDVTYNYSTPTTSVTEPGSLAILALGLTGVALRRKKKSL